MKESTLLAAVAIVVTLQAATFGYVLAVESRLTRIETIIAISNPQAAQSAAAARR